MVVLLALFLVLQSQVALALERPYPALWMDFREGRLSLEVREGSWDSILQELHHRTGIHLRLHIRLEGPLSLSFKDLPIERALRRLFGPEANFIFWYPAAHIANTASDRPTEVWVIGKTGDAPTSRPALPDGPEAPTLALPTNTPEPESEWTTVFEKDPQAAQDPEVRQLVTDVLGNTEEPLLEQPMFGTSGDDGERERVDTLPSDSLE
jgi:hypothetical protein